MKRPFIEEDLKYISSLSLPWADLENKNILITGATGFIASFITETILHLNNNSKNTSKVFALVQNRDKAMKRFNPYLGRKDLEFIVQDVCDPVKIKEDVHYLIHTASYASPKYYGTDPVATLMPNVVGTYNLLELARKKKPECFLFFSSGEVYGELENEKLPNKETAYGYIDPMNIRSCYAESKRMGENMCACWKYQYDINTRVIRIFHTFGPGIPLGDGRVFSDFVSDIINKRDIVLNSDGSAKRTFCYLADAISAIFHILLKGENGEAYNMGNNRNEISILELAHLLVRLFPEFNLKVIQKESSAPKGYIKSKIIRACPDTSKLETLGWKPKFGLEEGFKRTIMSFLS
jgi:nucleoside-diphosphate-sugar epimerase